MYTIKPNPPLEKRFILYADIPYLYLCLFDTYQMYYFQKKVFKRKKNWYLFFSTLDADNSGFLDLREFLLAIELVAARTPEEKLIWAFRQYDRDNSSQLDQIELTKAVKSIYNMLKSIGESPKQDPDEKAKAMFTQIDINSDGFLTMEEFLRKIHHFNQK